jgi:transposase-like protein
MQDQPRLGAGMLDILMRGVSTRQYRSVIPEMADTAGVSKSSVSRQLIQASEAEVEALLDRRFEDVNLVIVFIDEGEFGDQVMIGVVGVDAEGRQTRVGDPGRGRRECHGGQRAAGGSGSAG